MKLLVDTSVWSLALRRDRVPDLAEVDASARALEGGELVVTTGLIVQEILQGFRAPRAKDSILDRFRTLPLLTPDFEDHVKAVALRNVCRRKGVHIGTIDALIAQLCIGHDLDGKAAIPSASPAACGLDVSRFGCRTPVLAVEDRR